MRWVSRLTTTAIVITLVVVVVLFFRSLIPGAGSGGGFTSSVTLHDASRLQPGSGVMIAGVRVGTIANMTITGEYALIDLALRDGIQIPIDSFVTRRADSLFGDNYLEIIPGDSMTMLKSGEPITHVEEGGSTDATLRTIARAMPKIDNALERVHVAMISGRKWINGSMVQTMNDVDRWVDEGRIEGPIESTDQAMARFERGADSAATTVADAVPVVAKRLADFDKAITSARGSMADAKKGITEGLADARAGFDRADKTIDDMTEVVAAVNQGKGDDWKGSLGRLVNDPEPANSIEDVTEAAAEGAAGLVRFKSWIGGRAELNFRTRSLRTYASAELYARKDQFYLLEFEYSDLGGAPLSDLSEVPGQDEFVRTQEIKDKVRFTAQYGKRIGKLQLRAGLRESTPGVGADGILFNGRLRLSADAFGSFTRVPHLKFAGALAVFRSLYIIGGVDDVLNSPGELPVRYGNDPTGNSVPEQFKTLKYGRDYFLGLSLKISDVDLATLLRFYGALIVANALGI